MTVINFPPTPDPGDTYTENNITYTWDGEKWTALPLTRDSMVAPEIGEVTLTDNNEGGRFTSERFTLTATMAEDGDPASSKQAKAVITPEIQAKTLTTPIETISDVSFADDITMYPSSENNWSHIGWAGPPFNMYIAFATGGSNSFKWAWSEDGETWNQFQGPLGASTSAGINWCYRTVNQTIYVGNAGQNTVYNTISTREQLLNYENNGEAWSTSRPHDNPSHRTNMFYDPVNDRITSTRGPWDVSNSYVTIQPFPSTLTDSGWRSCGGQGGAYVNYGDIIINRLGNAYAVGTCSPHNEATYNQSWALDLADANCSIRTSQYTRDANSYSGRRTYHPGFNRWYNNGWYWEGDDPTSAPSSIGSWTGWAQNVPKQDGASLYHMFYSSQLDQLICVGSIRVTGSSNYQYCHWRSDDGGDTWTDAILTNPLTQETGYWNWGLDATEIGAHLLCSGGGDVAGKRFGKSITFGSNETLPQLTFESNAGLELLSVGQAIEQADGNASGNIAFIDIDDARIVVSNTVGTWQTGQRVVTPLESYTQGFAVSLAEAGAIINIELLSPGDPGWFDLEGNGPWDIQFPATFTNTGNAPDDDIPAGGTIQVEFRALSQQNGYIADSTASSNQITPT